MKRLLAAGLVAIALTAAGVAIGSAPAAADPPRPPQDYWVDPPKGP